jgi:hypothetical protein
MLAEMTNIDARTDRKGRTQKRTIMGRPVPKEEVRRLLDNLFNEAAYDDIQYPIYVQKKDRSWSRSLGARRFHFGRRIEQRIARWGWAARFMNLSAVSAPSAASNRTAEIVREE